MISTEMTHLAHNLGIGEARASEIWDAVLKMFDSRGEGCPRYEPTYTDVFVKIINTFVNGKGLEFGKERDFAIFAAGNISR